MSDLIGNPEDGFSHNEAHISSTENDNDRAFVLQLCKLIIHSIRTCEYVVTRNEHQNGNTYHTA